jgi:DNA (cytosine-5)-methyltransferase 1
VNVLDLFSGIGGFSLGLEAAGMRTVAFCEIEPYCQTILRERWPGVQVHEDVRKLDGFRYRGTVDLVCGGYPCQPFSMAGRRAGAEDERHLWPEMLRVIRGCGPRWVVAENVAGHITLGFDEVASSLEAEGFAVWPFVLPACAVGAPHRRDRLWIVAHAKSQGKQRKAGDVSETNGRPQREMSRQPDGAGYVANPQGACGIEPASETDTSATGGQSGDGFVSRSKAVADASRLQPRRQKQRAERQRTGSRRQSVDASSGVSDSTGCAQQRRGFSAFPEFLAPQCSGWWESEPDVGRVAHGISHRVDRLRALGNAIVPQIAAIIGQAIMTYEKENP